MIIKDTLNAGPFFCFSCPRAPLRYVCQCIMGINGFSFEFDFAEIVKSFKE